ncbi:LuxR C-terminal-related transcriptional regulator [Rhodovulum sp. P5]|uniref:helix-turn-helix transcriptional regulator n=1 Tax=Rhodovulum sp. P5 TaxID=1564506 RepID=UPI0009D9317D|nr:LuxR C-terminal-related transcriptional regulator [Rhodovulum sp. P5]
MKPKLSRATWLLILSVPVLSAGMLGIDMIIEGTVPRLAEFALDFAEKCFLFGSMVLIAMMVGRVDTLEADSVALRRDLALATQAGEAWRQQSRKLMQGLSDAITQQFDRWNLSPAEADVAGLMLKGLSLREIAGLRQSSEATVRQQAQNVYRKSGLANRAELSAYFLEDLFAVAGSGLSPDAENGAVTN